MLSLRQHCDSTSLTPRHPHEILAIGAVKRILASGLAGGEANSAFPEWIFDNLSRSAGVRARRRNPERSRRICCFRSRVPRQDREAVLTAWQPLAHVSQELAVRSIGVCPSALIKANLWLNGFVVAFGVGVGVGFDFANYQWLITNCWFSDYETETASVTVSETVFPLILNRMHGKTESTPFFRFAVASGFPVPCGLLPMACGLSAPTRR